MTKTQFSGGSNQANYHHYHHNIDKNDIHNSLNNSNNVTAADLYVREKDQCNYQQTDHSVVVIHHKGPNKPPPFYQPIY
jgi:hypothetical protein